MCKVSENVISFNFQFFTERLSRKLKEDCNRELSVLCDEQTSEQSGEINHKTSCA